MLLLIVSCVLQVEALAQLFFDSGSCRNQLFLQLRGQFRFFELLRGKDSCLLTQLPDTGHKVTDKLPCLHIFYQVTSREDVVDRRGSLRSGQEQLVFYNSICS